MTLDRIPWDGPSSFGRSGVLARQLVRRMLRPVTVRVDAELARLEGEVSRLQDDQARTAEYLGAVDQLLDVPLVHGLSAGSRHRTSRGGSRVICSLAIGDYRSLLSRSALSFERYAERWGWDVVLSTEDLTDGRPAPWAKVKLLQELLHEYEWVLWLDADVVIVDFDADISAEIQSDKDLYLVEHPWLGQYTANTGVMLLRNCAWTHDFLEDVWAHERYIEHPWWENAAVLDLLGYGLEPARLVEPTAHLGHTKFIDRRWNSIELDRPEVPAFVHRGFHDLSTRIRHVTGDLACALGGADPLTAGRDRPARRIERVTDVHRREELPLLLNSLGLTGTGVEVGVRKGDYSEHLLAHWKGEKLISIDPWRAAPPDDYRDVSNVSQDEHDVNYLETCRRLARFGRRSEVRREAAAQAVQTVSAACLDVVYLDARHDADSVSEDLALWWPIVRPGGVLAGHDYRDGMLPEGVFGVRTAVDRFFSALGVPVHATADDAPWPSWLVVKP
ncbi:MAG TPA: class I SAM-dependent methyltransferase [Solirubrobacteraceae bacterium]|nr:class I SAM-dependent methyltransferase [Solirubrobacteraceae bacterium]